MHYSTFALALTTVFSYHVLATPQPVPPQFRSACSKWPEFVDTTATVTQLPAVTNTVTVSVPNKVWKTSPGMNVLLVRTEYISTVTKSGGTTTIYQFPDSTAAPRLTRVRRSGPAKPTTQSSSLVDVSRTLCSYFVTPTTVISTTTPTIISTVSSTDTDTFTYTTYQPGITSIFTTTLVATTVIPAATATVAACGTLDNIDWSQTYGVADSSVNDAPAGSGLECCKRCHLTQGCDMWLFYDASCRVYTNGNFGNGQATDNDDCPFGKDNILYSVPSLNQGGYAGVGPCGIH